MSHSLGTLEELPKDYIQALSGLSVAPLWPSLRAVLPHDAPNRATKPFAWRYTQIREHLMRAGDLTPIEKAERRVLVLCNPGLGLDRLIATPTIYAGLQLILPGETAEPHRHTPSAIRFVIEGDGGYTIVNGEKCPMEKGDLILTPSGTWHEHWHAGKKPVVWLDALDLPIIHALEHSYVIEGKRQAVNNAADRSQTSYRRAGLVPYASLGKRREDYPLIRFPWREVRQSLVDLATGCGPKDPVHLAYVNPETGGECLPILGFSAQMLRQHPARDRRPRRLADRRNHDRMGRERHGCNSHPCAGQPPKYRRQARVRVPRRRCPPASQAWCLRGALMPAGGRPSNDQPHAPIASTKYHHRSTQHETRLIFLAGRRSL